MTVPSEVKTGELAAVKVQDKRYKLWDEHLMRMKEIEADLSKAYNSKLAAQGNQVRALEEDTVALEGKMTVSSEVKTGELAAIKVQDKRHKLWDEHLMRMKKKRAARSKANNRKPAAQGNQVRALEEDTVALEGKMTVPSEVKTGELAAIKVQDKRHKLWDEHLMRMKKKRAARSKANNRKLAAQGNQVKALEEDTVALEGKMAVHSEVMTGELAAVKVQGERYKLWDEHLMRMKEIEAAHSKAYNSKLAAQGNQVKALEEDTVALEEKVAPLIMDFSRVELVVTEVEERQAHSQKIDSMDKETQTSELPQDENNALQEELMELRASYHEVCLNQTLNQEKLNAELQEEKQEKNVLQEELMKLRTSYHEVCLNQTLNQEKLNAELQVEKQEKKVLQEELMKLRASHHEVCQNQTLNEEKWNAELQEKNILQEQLVKLRASHREVCQNQTLDQEKLNNELQVEKQEKKLLEEELLKLQASYHEVCSLLYAADVSSGQLNGESKEDVTEEKSLSSVLPEKQKKPSVWKRFRHALGLRKPQRWKKSAAPSNST
ncbi:golgin subfamily A member 6-like protein 24 [Paralichthys olivaceus]|uniref:golgin subfamily A member 6-like protein 24 n=1 Tax=Paralichthys olivaceus TaxID=8255 RepID=UPI0037521D75